ncbi:PilX N-terminal domain-containing pilus assembly protein, partial [Xanthomonas citri pv. citri]
MTASRQRGIALVVTLLLLLIVTLLGLAAMRGTLLQERMAANAMA